MTAPALPDVTRVLGQYELRAPQVIGRTQAGIINHNLIVEDARGSKYFLHGYRRVRDLERITFQVRFQEHLLERGFPTAAVIPTRDGARFLVEDQLLWVLFDLVEGEEYDFSRVGQAAEAGRVLALFHEAAEPFAEKEPTIPGGTLQEFFGAAPGQPGLLRAFFAGRGVDAEVEQGAAWWEGFTRAWPRERLEALPERWVHSDYHGRNLTFVDDRVTGLFDFDYLGRGPRVIDVGRGVFNFARSARVLYGDTNEVRAGRRMRPAFARAFIDSYQSVEPLTAEEWRSLPIMAALSFLPHAGWYEMLEKEGTDVVERLRRDMGVLHDVEEQVIIVSARLGWPV